MTSARDGGFTLVELMIVIVVSIPILLAVVSTSESAGRAVNTTERAAEASEAVRKVAERTGQIIRAASWSTFRVKATAADVSGGMATFVGEWIAAIQNDPRPNIQFQSASGTLTLNATDLTTPRELEFEVDASETVNSADDDGDGLIDEGRLFLQYEATRVPIAEGVESCTFELDNGVVRFAVQCARGDGRDRVHRATAQHVWSIRNQ